MRRLGGPCGIEQLGEHFIVTAVVDRQLTSPPVLDHVSDPDLVLEVPTIADGQALWRLAADSGTLDVNSPYSYLLWCRDFAITSVIARSDGEKPIGFVIGYRRPNEATTLLVWQVAVDADHRGVGIAGRMLDHLTHQEQQDPTPVTHVETSITPDNQASHRLFSTFAKRWGVAVERRILFEATLFPNGHLAEELYRIGPFDP